MPLNDAWLYATEGTQGAMALLCVWEVARCLTEAKVIRRRVLSTGENHGADVWSANSVRSKRVFLFIEFLLLGWCIDRMHLIASYQVSTPGRFLVYGILRTVTAVLCAWNVWMSSRGYRGMRGSK